MKKLVLAIIGVICVQFVFVHYMTLQTPFEVSLGPVNAESEIAQTIPFYDEDEPPLVSGAQPAVRTSRPNLKASIAEVIAPRERQSKTSFRPVAAPKRVIPESSPRMATRRDFETIVISYNGDSTPRDCEPRIIAQPKRRPSTARAILKKPWEWMKAFGSKFN